MSYFNSAIALWTRGVNEKTFVELIEDCDTAAEINRSRARHRSVATFMSGSPRAGHDSPGIISILNSAGRMATNERHETVLINSGVCPLFPLGPCAPRPIRESYYGY